MPNTQELLTNLIPFADQLYVDRFRTFLNDTVAENELDLTEESSDTLLWHCLKDTLDEINYEIPPIRSSVYTTISEVPSWSVMKFGATLHILVSKGILSARNQLTWNDAGGITVRDQDKYGRYVNWFNVLSTRYARMARSMKMSANIDDCYGGVHSEYFDIGY